MVPVWCENCAKMRADVVERDQLIVQRDRRISELESELAEVRGTVRDVVYFIRRGDRVKIGTTRHLATRLGQHERDGSFVFLGAVRGGHRAEARWHRRFDHLRLTRAEWFAADPELLIAIQALPTFVPRTVHERRRIEGSGV